MFFLIFHAADQSKFIRNFNSTFNLIFQLFWECVSKTYKELVYLKNIWKKKSTFWIICTSIKVIKCIFIIIIIFVAIKIAEHVSGRLNTYVLAKSSISWMHDCQYYYIYLNHKKQMKNTQSYNNCCVYSYCFVKWKLSGSNYMASLITTHCSVDKFHILFCIT